MNGSNAGEHAGLVRAEIPAFAGMTRWLLRELRWSGPDGFLVVKAFAFRSRGYKPGRLLGRRQVVRHRFLVPAFAGSNPPPPASSLGVRHPPVHQVEIILSQQPGHLADL